MLKSLSIKNFRNFRSLEIDSLSQVNLIVGKNNAGKSNLLDAIALYVSQGNPRQLFDLLEARKECRFISNERISLESLKDSLSSFFYGRTVNSESSDEIVIQDSQSSQILKISFLQCIIEKPDLEDLFTQHHLHSTALNFGHANKLCTDSSNNTYAWLDRKTVFLVQWISDLIVNPLEDRWHIDITSSLDQVYFSHFDTKTVLQYARTQFIQNRNNAELWDDIDLTDKEEYALDALRILLPEMTRLAYKSNRDGERIPYAKLRNHTVPVPLYSLGEGVNRALTIILHLVNAENGTVLIDEFENGLHYTIQEPLWRMIFQVTKKLNIQLFATTHSEDCLRAFNKLLQERTYSESGQIISLAQVKDDIECSVYNASHLKEAFESEMEVR